MTDTYYRLHRTDAPTFSADNAWSAPWGEAFGVDGDRYECRSCDGSGSDVFGEHCGYCDGEGWFDCAEGYSCCESAEDLLAYFDRHCPANYDDPVVVFEGDYCGQGCDGEPLVVPTAIVWWTTIGQLRVELA